MHNSDAIGGGFLSHTSNKLSISNTIGNANKSVKNVVFRLVLTGEDVSIENLTSAYGIIDDKVNKIQNAIENNIWQSPEDCKEICMYCDYKYICRDIIDVNEKADKESDDE